MISHCDTSPQMCYTCLEILTKVFNIWFPKHIILNDAVASLDSGVVFLYLCHIKGDRRED